ncbi:MAG: immune inhibitor A [Deltaproteobacteria bacterium]|jgi:M6 family metalloprotease-like protein|nr:immune inhibitor A [Deltaproteobacteria bacterium]MDL1986473.1 immune inhibitor A [Deltaproteobacteria bacterium]
MTVEHLAGTTGSHLIHFYWSPAPGHWQAQDLTLLTEYSIIGNVTAWVTPDGPYTVEHIAGCDLEGRLLVFYRSTRDDQWKIVDVTEKTGRYVFSGFTSWQTPNGPYNVEHVAARDADGRLLVFWWSPAHDWQVVDVTAKTGYIISSDITSWQIRRDPFLYEYLAATSSANGRIIVFSWTPEHDWRAQETWYVSSDGATPWLVGDVEHLAGVGTDGTLFVLWRHGTEWWRRVDITDITGERVEGRPTSYQLMDGEERVELLGARSPDGHALVFWWKPSRDWQAMDLTEISCCPISTPPESWVTDSGAGRSSEHLAAVDVNGDVRVFYSYDQPRTMTDQIGETYRSISRMRNTQRKVLVVLWDPHYPGIPQSPEADIIDALFGSSNSMRNYFLENSGGTFIIQNTGVLGWYDAPLPLEYYDNPDDPHDKAGGALRAANPDFNFAAYDNDGDGTLEPHELAIVFAHPGGGSAGGGLVRTGGREVRDLDGSPLVLDGVLIRECVEVAIGDPIPNFGVVVHELSHLLLGLPDMYFTFFTPTAPGIYSIMDQHWNRTHIDEFNKLKLGWAHPRLIFRFGQYSVPDIETRHRVLVLVDPSRSMTEYFLIANRWPGMSYDAMLPDEGLAVWHIMEEAADYDAALPPPTVDMTKWGMLGSGDGAWGRKAIRMIRPILTSPFNDGRALWETAEGDLVSDEPDLEKPALRWGDGTPSGFTLRNISTPNPDMELTIDVP